MSDQQKDKTLKVLAIEDEAANLHLIVATLQDRFKVFAAKSLEKARVLLEKHRFDIILLDVNLPDGSGFDLCRELIGLHPINKDARIIFMTGLTGADDEVKGLKLGAADYIHKPFNPAVLMARINLQAQLIRKDELLDQLARLDALTEIANRRAFDDQFAKELQRAKRDNALLTIALLDIDHFKFYNDTYGHPAGDSCLHDFAQLLSSQFQRGSDFVFRYGGEEFAVILTGTEHDQVQRLFEQLQSSLKDKAIEHKSSPVLNTVSFSAGFVSLIPTTQTIEELLKSADEQLYNAKQTGRKKTMGLIQP